MIVSFFRFFSFPFLIESTSNKTVQLLQEMKLQRKKEKKRSKKPIKRSIKMPDVYRSWHSFLQGWNPPFLKDPPCPFLGTPLFLKQIQKFTPLFLRAIQIGACKLYEVLT